MADESRDSGGQAPAEQQPQAGNAPTTPTTTTTTEPQPMPSAQPQAGSEQHSEQQPSNDNQNSSSDKQTSEDSAGNAGNDLAARIERMEKALKEANAEAAKYRTKAKELDKLREDEESAKLSEVERERKRAERAEAVASAARERIGTSELKMAAKDAGIIDTDDALVHLLPKLTFDREGEPENVADLVRGLKVSKPHLFQRAAAPTTAAATPPAAAASGLGATNPPRANGPIAITADQYMSPHFASEFRAKYHTDLMIALRSGQAKIV